MDAFEKEMKEGFLEEAAGLLADAEQCFLELETAANNPSIVEKIFRLAHNFKGSANAVGFMDLGSFAHVFESFLLKVKNKELPVCTETVNVLLKCNDHLGMTVVKLREDMTAKIDSSELSAELLDYIEGRKVAGASEETPSPESFEAPAPETFAAPSEEVGNSTALPAPELFQEEPAASAAPISTPAPVAPVAAAAPPPPPAPAAGAPQAATQDESIRVSLQKVDALINNVGEIVILQTVLNQQRMEIANPLVQKTIAQLAKITKDLQEGSMSLRMLPLKQTFTKMQRIVRDCAKQLGKEVELETNGEETEIDKTILELLGDPLVHLIRNAVDHGIETGDERVAAGKSRNGHILLSGYHRGENIVIEIKDDGKGLDADKLRSKGIEKGILSPNSKISDKEAYQLIFAPGFSTKAQVTDISGRGVGMDVVRTNIEKLKGEIDLETSLGHGTTFRILLPLTLAIIDGVVVLSDTERFVVPISNIYESVQPAQQDVHSLNGVGQVFCLRGENLPLFRLSGLMGRKPTEIKKPWDSLALVIRDTVKPCAILVDDIIGQQQVVIKKLGNEIRNIPGLTGGAILGDGKAALIIDLHGLVDPVKTGTPSRSH